MKNSDTQDVLYHYCSTSTLISIIQSRSLHLCSLSVSNDATEGKLLSKILPERARKDKVSWSRIFDLKHEAENLEKRIDCLGFCLSENGDMVSQWLEYASNAMGVCIGFSGDLLQELAKLSTNDMPNMSLRKVHYQHEAQHQIFEDCYQALKAAFAERRSPLDGFLGSNPAIRDVLSNFHNDLYCVKEMAFSGEREWRLMRPYANATSPKMEFRALPDRITPYLPLIWKDRIADPIVSITIGPKNITPDWVFQNLLKQNGFGETPIGHSKAPYR